MNKVSLLLCLFISSLCFSQQNNQYLLLMTTSSAPANNMFLSKILWDSTIFCSSESGYTRLIPSFKIGGHSNSIKNDYESCLKEKMDVSDDYSLLKYQVDSVEGLVIRNDTCFYTKMSDKEYHQTSMGWFSAIELYRQEASNSRTIYSDSTKVICGYKCQYGQVVFSDSGELLMSFWYSPLLKKFSSPLSRIANCPEFIMSIQLNSVMSFTIENSETNEGKNIDLPKGNVISFDKVDVMDHFILPLDRYKFEKVDNNKYENYIISKRNEKWVKETLN